jgi:hypothetical protein
VTDAAIQAQGIEVEGWPVAVRLVLSVPAEADAAGMVDVAALVRRLHRDTRASFVLSEDYLKRRTIINGPTRNRRPFPAHIS